LTIGLLNFASVFTIGLLEQNLTDQS
jgi:hypothetical protein